jgi:glycine cleavage system H lipoate-binding protein
MKKGWLFRLKVSKPAQFDVLLDEQAYQSMLERPA